MLPSMLLSHLYDSIASRTGNYDTYVRTRTELEENQMKQWQKEQDQVQPPAAFIFTGVYSADWCLLWCSIGLPLI